MIRKGQATWLSGADVRRQIQFINNLFEVDGMRRRPAGLDQSLSCRFWKVATHPHSNLVTWNVMSGDEERQLESRTGHVGSFPGNAISLSMNLANLAFLSINLTNLASHWLGVAVSRDDVESNDISSTLDALSSLLVDDATVRKFQERVNISFDGFDHDPLEVYEIPEIRRFCAELDKSFPYWLYFLSTEDSSLKMMAFCLCRVNTKAPGLAILGRGALGFCLSSHFVGDE